MWGRFDTAVAKKHNINNLGEERLGVAGGLRGISPWSSALSGLEPSIDSGETEPRESGEEETVHLTSDRKQRKGNPEGPWADIVPKGPHSPTRLPSNVIMSWIHQRVIDEIRVLSHSHCPKAISWHQDSGTTSVQPRACVLC